MCLQSNITKRGGSAVYYARVSRPVELIEARKRAGLSASKDVWKSLGTRDPKEAKHIGRAVITQLYAQFARELEQLKAGQVTESQRERAKPDRSEIQTAAWEQIHGDLATYDRARAARGGLPESDFYREARAVELGILSGQPYESAQGYELVSPADHVSEIVAAIVETKHWDALPGSQAHTDLTNAVIGALRSSLTAIQARNAGDYLNPTANPQRPAESVTRLDERKAKRGESLLELLDTYADEVGKLQSRETQAKRTAAVRLFAESVGLKRDVKTITSVDVRNFKNDLKLYPQNAAKYNDLKGKSFPQIIAIMRKRGGSLPTIKDKTLNNYLSLLGGFFQWLYANGYSTQPDITRGLALKVNKRENARDSIELPMLEKLFSLPVFTGSAPESDRAPGDHRVNDWRFWVPLVCIYSGARLGEVAQLRIKDVLKIRGHWCLAITDDGEGMTIKNKHSIRNVPIHPELIRLGFLKFASAQAGNPDDRLFPEIEPDEYGRYSTPISKWWTAYAKAAGLSGSLHQFRHTFVDALREAGYMDADFQPLIGHKSGTTTELYGNLPQLALDKRIEMIGAVKYPFSLKPI